MYSCMYLYICILNSYVYVCMGLTNTTSTLKKATKKKQRSNGSGKY